MTKKVLISLDELLEEIIKHSMSRAAIMGDFALMTKAIPHFIHTAKDWFKLQPEAPQWVSVEDGLPLNNSETDFVAVVNDDISWQRAFYYDGDWLNEDENYVENVTHWMPIPGLPGKDDDN